jgi:tRNA nucleotidyltransferase (CCA-adding enzyme)
MQVFLVGGAVRDALLGRPQADRDWVVVGATPQALLDRGFKPVGRDFPVFLHPETGEEYALARTERKSGHGYHGFTFHADPSITLEDDLRRRDLTINAIARADDGTLVDPFGGARDLADRVLRHVSPAFVEDPLRVLRVARFAARFAPLGFRVAEETVALMRAIGEAGELAHLVPERVWAELAKALGEPRPSAFLRVLRDCGALARLLPEVDALYGVPQRAEYHPEIDAGIHQELVCDQAARLAPGDTVVGLAALLHDLGKGLTPAEVLPRHIGHEHAGLPLVAAVCERLKVPGEHAAAARHACRYHLDVHRALQLEPKTVLALIEGIDGFRRPERLRTLLLACEADHRGRLGLDEREYPQAPYLAAAHAAAAAVDARQLVAEGLQGPAIGEAMRRARIAAIAQVRAQHAPRAS